MLERLWGRVRDLSHGEIALLLFAVSTPLLFYRIDQPSHMYFDEEYYVEAARAILNGTGDPNWVHPPAGKMMIALGILLLGDRSYAWRFPGALLAVYSVVALYFIAFKLFDSRKVALLSSLFLLTDLLFYVQARIATLDIYVLSFSIFSIFFMLYSFPGREILLIPTSLCLGMAIACKLPGLYLYPLILAYSLYHLKGKGRKKLVIYTLILLLLPAITYTATYFQYFQLHGFDLQAFINYQIYMAVEVVTIPGTHIYASEPWTWPLILRSMPYYYAHITVDDTLYISSITASGNIITWYLGLVSILFTLYRCIRYRRLVDGVPLAWYLITFLPFFPTGIAHAFFSGGRVQFIYYYLQSVPGLHLILSHVVDEADKRTGYPIASTVLSAAISFFAFGYPGISGLPVPYGYPLYP